MTDPLSTSRQARESLSRGLNALQADPSVPTHLVELAAPIAQAMGALHQIERTSQLAPHADVALTHVRSALAQLQAQPTNHPAVTSALEAVAGSLSLVHSLSKMANGPAPAPPQPAPQPASPPAHAAPPAPPAPAVQQVQPPPPAPIKSGTANLPQQAPPQPAFPQPAAQPSFPQPIQQAPAPTAQNYGAPPQPVVARDPFAAADPFAAPPPQASPSPAFHNGPNHGVADMGKPASPSMPVPAPPPQGNAQLIAADLGAHSITNFYKGLAGNDIIDHGGLFVSTYMTPKVGTPIRLKVSLPGGYEFEANAVVKWTREQSGDASPGFGAQFTGITNEARQLVYRYVRNREPLFHDDF